MSRSSHDDDERTLVGGVTGPPWAASPKFVTSSSMHSHTLPEGTRVGDVEITGLIGEGGFGIVYLATDHSLQRQVAIKEYMPSSLAARSGDGYAVAVKSERHRETFAAGLKSFVNEARLLARFDHASLVKVYRFWEANDTAYMMMPFYEGPTLKHALASLGHAPDEALLRTWLRPLLDALEVIHGYSCFHRDIAPDNILLTPTGPLLLDFGAARRVIGDMTHALTVVLKPGYAPVEQYGESAKMAQGAWTDLYALACVVYYAITGSAPMTSVERLMDDSLVPLAQQAAGRYSPTFLNAIDAALAVRPQHRPQDVWQFRALLDGNHHPGPRPQPSTVHASVGLTQPFPAHGVTLPMAPAASPPLSPPKRAVSEFTPRSPPERTDIDLPLLAPQPAAPPPVARAPIVAPQPTPPRPPPPVATPKAAGARKDAWSDPEFDAPNAQAQKRRALLWLAGAVAVATLAGGGVWWKKSHGDATDAAPGVVTPTPAPVPAPVPVPTPPAPAPEPAPAPAPAPEPAPAPPAPAPAPQPDTAPPAAEPAPAPAPVAAPSTRPPVTKPVKTAPTPKPHPTPAPASMQQQAPAPSEASAGKRAKCSDILQKASLENLSAEEQAYMRRECK